MNESSIMIAMSGGVDSAVAAYLAAKGRRAAGVTMDLAFEDGPHRENALRDIADAAATCQRLGLPHRVADLAAAFKEHVVMPFMKEYLQGRTPNPCVDCNKHVKFGALVDFVRQSGYDRLATGHYAQIERDQSGRYLLRRAKDHTKDQTYMLYSLSQDVLSLTEFPLGGMTKQEVRALALELGLVAAHKSDSQDICFIPNGEYGAFIEAHTNTPIVAGDFLSLDGRVLGRHRGVVHYTVGQRKGLGIALGHPAFVVRKSVTDNTVTLGKNEDLFTTRLTVRGINLIPYDTLRSPTRLLAKARYRQEAASARVEQTDADELTVEFEAPQRAVCAGQSLVLYDGEYVVGGGKII
ncbi:MAG: tRNA 2-thiouridine(34) synthase MnmA [Ruminococcaceae bacterium]|nr:tRNA 2-thiouridine(34) synthase MnmA [Oscillospiraceae bacterium]